jgi:hypothetical protein
VIKNFFGIGMATVLLLTLLVGCSSTSKASNLGKYEILRKATLGGKWQMYQLQITLESGKDFDIDLLDLANNDKVDGYFYPEKGSGGTLTITAGTQVLYQTEGTVTAGTLSDRFSFTASQPAGTAYVLKLHNGGTEKSVSIFLELIYPNTGNIRGPIDTK